MKRPVPHVAFPPDALAYLRQRGGEISFAEEEPVVRRGEPGSAFWVVLEGMVEIRLTGEDAVKLPLARFGVGASFGEMSLITGDPVSADVVSLTAVRLLRYPAEHFAAALGECEPLRTHVMSHLANNLRGTSTDVWRFYQKAKTLNVLRDQKRDWGPLVAESGASRKLRELVQRRGKDAEPVLVGGAPGTGKLFVAAKIHEEAGDPEAPFITVDARTLPAGEEMKFLFGSESYLAEEAGAGREAEDLRRYGALQLAHRGTIVVRHVDQLPRPVQEVLARYLELFRADALEYPRSRVVATVAGDPAASRAHPALLAACDGRTITVPRLLERRKDILPLARVFLGQRVQGAQRELGRSAEHTLVSLRYTHRNAAELREAVDMAAVIADERAIQAEHIFSGPKDQGTVHEFDLSPFAIVKGLTAPRTLAALRGAVLVLFAAVVAASLAGDGGPAGNLANAATWGLWEPGLFVVFLFLGRLWCTVCPLSTAGRIAARLGSLGVQPGAWIKNWSGWIVVAGFLAIVWTEWVFGMAARPRAAGLLLLALFGLAAGSAVVFRRETWCRYLCPLGSLGGVYALPAALTVRANPDVCATLCTTHDCFKGTPGRPGCPVFHHPLYASEAFSCKKCFQCLRVCRHGSARLYLRPPLQSIWAQATIGEALVPFAIFLFFFAPAMLAAQGEGWPATVPGFTATALLALALTVFVRPRLRHLLSTGRNPDPDPATRVAFALLLLAWGPAMAYQLQHVPELDSLRFHAEPGTLLAGHLPAGELSLLWVGQVGVTLLAGLLAGICLLGVYTRLLREREEFSRHGWNLVMGVGLLYFLGTLALIVPRGLHLTP